MSTDWAVEGADVVFFRQTSKGVVGNVTRARVASVSVKKIALTDSGGQFALDSRLSRGWADSAGTPLYRKADGWGGRWIVAPVGHPLLAEVDIEEAT